VTSSRKGRAALRSAVGGATRPLEARAGGNAFASAPVLWGILLAALLVRLLFIGADGFSSDVGTFEAWSLALADHPLRQFFASVKFADYPPGYFFVLWFVGHAYKLLVHSDPSYTFLKIAVKLPAILMDLVDSALIFAIVRRLAPVAWAYGAAAFFAFNPATIFISAYWGQVDSVAAGFTLGSLLLMIDAGGRTGRAQALTIVGAWLLLAYSVLIKPPAIVVAPLFLAFVFATDENAERVRRALATAAGIVAAFVLAFLSSFAFNGNPNPVAEFVWLYGRYAYASGVYAYNSVNAFNLYVMAFNHFWQPDGTVIPGWSLFGHTVGFPQYVWGIALFVAAVLLVLSRYVQRRDPAAILEAAMILSLGYFVLSTRMHERYIFNAVLLASPLIYYARRYRYAAILLSVTLFLNLCYSLDYLNVMSQQVQDVDPSDLMPWLSRPAALLNVVTFFYLGYVFLGAGGDVLEGLDFGSQVALAGATVRRWFSPLEGTARMLRRDWGLAAGLGIASFLLSFAGYAWPSEKIFDEIYYARAGEEYLSHKEIFEFTHPPLTKLWITLSMMLFGGMHGAGDTSAGWRFLNLVMGALMVFVLYCFAKRLLGSTLFATIAAGLLVFEGFHFVQSRIATPEITVAFFSLLTLYAFYRFWIASQVRVAPAFGRKALVPHAVALAIGLVIAGVFSALIASGQDVPSHVVAFLYAGAGAYLVVRLIVPRFTKAPALTSYADGSYVTAGTLRTPDGGSIPLAGGTLSAGGSTAAEKNALVHTDPGLRIEYARGGAMRYATDAGEARFTAAGTMQAGDATIDGARDGLIWLWILAFASAALAASKWNGLFDFFVIWILVAAVIAQRLWAPLLSRIFTRTVVARPAVWGNPLGFSFDILVAAMAFVGGTIYTLCYIPYFSLGHNLSDLVGLQQQMFNYHYDLKATHPYGSHWWQWPFIGRPISYYYHDFRSGAATQDPMACCVAEIMALPNPAIWWFGLVTVPLVGVLAVWERNKGYALLIAAYLLQWLPWMTSPRVAFEYHFFPNDAIICLADAVVLQRIWHFRSTLFPRYPLPKLAVGAYVTLVVVLFVFFYPILAGTHVRWYVWDARMWHWLMQNNWV
jgi:Gpi18-like mannosyltransferase